MSLETVSCLQLVGLGFSICEPGQPNCVKVTNITKNSCFNPSVFISDFTCLSEETETSCNLNIIINFDAVGYDINRITGEITFSQGGTVNFSPSININLLSVSKTSSNQVYTIQPVRVISSDLLYTDNEGVITKVSFIPNKMIAYCGESASNPIYQYDCGGGSASGSSLNVDDFKDIIDEFLN